MQKPPLDPDVADTAPTDSILTPYDHEHAVTYLRLLDADAEGADWRESDGSRASHRFRARADPRQAGVRNASRAREVDEQFRIQIAAQAWLAFVTLSKAAKRASATAASIQFTWRAKRRWPGGGSARWSLDNRPSRGSRRMLTEASSYLACSCLTKDGSQRAGVGSWIKVEDNRLDRLGLTFI